LSYPSEFQSRAAELIEAGRFIHARGWVPATSGNFSARISGDEIAITVSGRHKGRLRPEDIMRVDGGGQSLDGGKPSAETLLHVSLYRRFPNIGAVLHPHSPGAVLVSRLFRDELALDNHELLKALAGVASHETRVAIPIFANDQNIPRLAAAVEAYLDQHDAVYGYIIAGHGFYTWGESVDDALRHVEALEFLFEIEARLKGAKPL
jgi:methylthioribulose-1-phosphate dehydratase